MIGKLLALFVGGRRGGARGAAMGYAAERVVTRMGPFGWFLAALYGLWRLFFGRRKRRETRY